MFSIHSTSVEWVASRNRFATFWAYNSDLDSAEDEEPSERLGSSGIVVCPGGVVKTTWGFPVERRSWARRVARDEYVDVNSFRSSILSMLTILALPSKVLMDVISIRSILFAYVSITRYQFVIKRNFTFYKLLRHSRIRDVDILITVIVIIDTKQVQICLSPFWRRPIQLEYISRSLLCPNFPILRWFGRHFTSLWWG